MLPNQDSQQNYFAYRNINNSKSTNAQKMDSVLQFSTQLRYINQHILQQRTALVPGIMALIHPQVQDTKLGLVVSPLTTNLPIQDTLTIWLM